jgi:hypothetical protein
MKRIICAIVAVTFLCTGCSAFVSKTQPLNASCSEPDATLQINGGQAYPGKAQIEARRDKVVTITCYKQGFYPAQKSVSHSLSGTGVADFIGGLIFIVPIVGFFTPGAFNLDESDVTVNMVKYE